MVRLKTAYWEFDFEAVCPTLDHDFLSQAHMCVCVCVCVLGGGGGGGGGGDEIMTLTKMKSSLFALTLK